jgi:hypothetical protein
MVVIQPGVSSGVRWEILRTLEVVEPRRIIFSLAGYWRHPNEYEDFLLILPEWLRRRMPREVPYLDRPAFVYFGSDWTPRLQLLSYRSPLVWTFVGNAVNLKYTLRPFLQGASGGPHELPSRPKRHFGHAPLAWLTVPAIPLLTMAALFSATFISALFHAQRYQGAVAPYSVVFFGEWQHAGPPHPSGHYEDLFLSEDRHVRIIIECDKGALNVESYLREYERRLGEEVPGAQVSRPDTSRMEAGGGVWTVALYEIRLPDGAVIQGHTRVHVGDGWWVALHGLTDEASDAGRIEAVFDTVTFE